MTGPQMDLTSSIHYKLREALITRDLGGLVKGTLLVTFSRESGVSIAKAIRMT